MQRALVFLALATASVSAAELFPFTLPWDDASPTVISLAHLNDRPAGREGHVQVREGHLFAGKKRLRIFGVNVCFGANFPTKEAAPRIAARMAKFGINCVRFHHMDMFSAPSGIFAKGGKTLDSEQLDRLDFFIAQLKEHGIYANLNLHVSRTYPDRPKSEKEGSPDYDKGVDNYFPAMIALQKEYARDLLTHVNAYTGVRYADEPAVAFVEINNENALGFQWWAGQMDDLPADYARELDQQWGKWISAKYATEEKARQAWMEGSREAGPELLADGVEWNHEQHGGASAKVANEGETIQVVVEKAGGEPWHVQFNRAGLRLAKDQSYEVRFRVRAPKAMKINVALQQSASPWKILGSSSVEAGPEWRDVSCTVRIGEADDKGRLSISGMGQTTGEFSFKSFSLRQAGIDGEVQRTADGSVASLKKRTFTRSTSAKQRDWQQFIWDTETKYWNGMRDYLKGDLGVKAPVVGTQGFWSPAHVQAGMDVIDSHAYWHHPDFHGRGWNQDVWSVKNESMAGAKEGGELARLAAQRVDGKPFICTEYNHPAPNTYSAETFPLILAFAAAQDWDGVFAFSYSHRAGDAWDQPHFNNFFDIDRHTVKMATLPASVAAFRQGNVYANPSKHVLSLTAVDTLDSAIRGGPGFMRNRAEFKQTNLFTTRFAGSVELTKTELRAERSNANTNPQMVWDSEAGIVTVNAPRSRLSVGEMKAGSIQKIGNVILTLGESRQDWGCFQITVLEGDSVATAKRILITATGDTENTGQGWTNGQKVSVGRKWGEAPVLVECPAATVELPGTGKLRAWALDETGARKTSVSFEGNRIKIGPEHRTLWYEVVRE